MKRTNGRGRLQKAADNLHKSEGGTGGSRAYDDDGKPEEGEEEETEKSLPSEADLIKAMDVLVDTVDGLESGHSVRQQDLAERMAAGEELTKSEREEMARFLNGDEIDDDFFAKSTRENWAEEPLIAEGWEMSGYLDARDTAFAKSLDEIKQVISSSNVENNAVVSRLAKGLHAVGLSNLTLRREVAELHDLLKSVTGRANAQPMAPKGSTRPSKIGQKFGEGQPANGTQANLTKSEQPLGAQGIPQDPQGQKEYLNSAITELIKSTEPGGVNAAEGFGVLRGVDLVFEQAKLENANQVSPQMAQIIAQHRGLDPSAFTQS